MKRILAIFICISLLSGGFTFVSNGEDDSVITITTAEEFDKIRKAPEKSYYLARDIVLPNSYVPFEFSGTLTGAESNILSSITVNIDCASEENIGLFKSLSGVVKIANIRVRGVIKGKTNVGGFFGAAVSVSPGSLIENCINEADIYAEVNVGGIGGQMQTDNLVISKTKNYGSVTASSRTAAGIVATSRTTKSNISLCKNYGNVTAINYVAGITAETYAGIDKCFNEGNITGRSFVGGIVGIMSGKLQVIKGAYNSGILTGYDEKVSASDVGGIVGGLNTGASRSVTLENCHNLGEVHAASGNFNPIYANYANTEDTSFIKAVDCTYLDMDERDDGKEGTTAIPFDRRGEIEDIISELSKLLAESSNLQENTWRQEEINKLGNAITMFVGSSNAFIKDSSELPRSIKIDKADNNIVPLIVGETVFLPVQFLSEHMGVSIKNQNTESLSLSLDGKEIKLSEAPSIIDGKIFVPLKATVEALGKNVVLDDSGLIIINDIPISPPRALLNKIEMVWVIPIEYISEYAKYALPGDELIIKNGTYKDITLNITARGKEDAPVIVRSQTPGGVIVEGASTIVISGEYLELKDIRFENCLFSGPIITFSRAYKCRMSGCYFFRCGNPEAAVGTMVLLTDKTQYSRVDHNVFEQSLAMTIGVMSDTTTPERMQNTYNLIDHNYFKDIRAVSEEFPGSDGNGLEAIQLGQTGDIKQVPGLFATVEYNLFENIIADHGEIFSNKSSGNIYRYNTFLNNMDSGSTMRMGKNCTVEGNFFINGRSGLRVYDTGHVIKNNYFYNFKRDAIRMETTDGDGLGSSTEGGYQRIMNNEVSGNIVINAEFGGLMLGDSFNSLTSYIQRPLRNQFKDNIFYGTKGILIREYGSEESHFENNLVKSQGSSQIGVEREGVIESDFELVFDGDIYLPSVRMDIDKQGLMDVSKVGPENKWWLDVLRGTPADYREIEPDAPPLRYYPAIWDVSVTEGTTYNLDTLNGIARYEGTKDFRVDPNKVQYTIKTGNDIMSIEGKTVIPKKTGVGVITAKYKGQTGDVTVRIVPRIDSEAKDVIYDKDFDFSSSLLYMHPVGSDVWRAAGGELVNIEPAANNVLIDHALILSGDYTFSSDVTLRNITSSPTLNGTILFGYNDNPNLSYYYVRFAQPGSTLGGIYKFDGYVHSRLSEMFVTLQQDKKYRAEIKKTDDNVVVLVDGIIAAVANVEKDLEGKVGFGSFTNMVSFDNALITRTEKEDIEVVDMPIEIERFDVNSANIKFEPIGETGKYVYRVFKNGALLADLKEEFFMSDVLIRIGESYVYTVEAYDMEGRLAGRGEAPCKLDEPKSDEFFMITDVLVKKGENGSYLSDIYRAKNRGLKIGTLIQVDRSYSWTALPEELLDSGYVRTANNDLKSDVFGKTGTDDWLLFDINKSATVYVLVNNNAAIPPWLSDWELIENKGFALNSLPGPLQIFKKHFSVNQGEKVTVKLGGYPTGVISVMYQVIVTPDVLPEPVKVNRVNSILL